MKKKPTIFGVCLRTEWVNPTMLTWSLSWDPWLVAELVDMASPFLEAEIDNTIRIKPTDKAPGPDGFNSAFIKNCWSIIKEDIYKLSFDFYENQLISAPSMVLTLSLFPRTTIQSWPQISAQFLYSMIASRCSPSCWPRGFKRLS